jgi:hypothetical protein
VLTVFSDIRASPGARQIAAARRELRRKGYDVED